VLILLFKNVLKISNFEKGTKTSKNEQKPKKTVKKTFKFFVCMRFYWGGKNFIIKKGLFYANFFEFEVKSYSPFFLVASSLSILCSLLGKKLKFAVTIWVFYNFQIQKRIVSAETIWGNTVSIFLKRWIEIWNTFSTRLNILRSIDCLP
jgi:hypothetical protein